MRIAERASIKQFIAANSDLLDGDVLDYGCGKQPYRKLVLGDYVGYDRYSLPGNVAAEYGPDGVLEQRWDAIICTQVIQYHRNPTLLIGHLYAALRLDGWLLLTGPTNWPEVEDDDLWRITASGIELLLQQPSNPFRSVSVAPRHYITINDIALSVGWAARAQR